MSAKTNPERTAATWFVALYSTVLMVVFSVAAIGLIGTPIQFILKDQLHLKPTQISYFTLLTDSPLFIGFAFGFLRDRWRPFGKGDQGYFLAVPILLALVYLWLGSARFTFWSFAVGMIVLSILSAILGAAAQGLLASIAKEHGMAGRLSVVTLVTARGAMMYSAALGGWLGDPGSHLPPNAPFIASAIMCLPVLIMAVWRPKSIFRSGNEVFVSVVPEGAMAAVDRLVRHKAIYLPAAMVFLFEFAPGWGTPLMFFLTDKKHLTEAQYGASQGWLRLGTVLAAFSYSWLCTRLKLRPLLIWGTFLAVLGAPAFLLIRSAGMANGVSFFAGVSCGIALGSYYDLLMRCCPKELEGVAFMLTASMFSIAADTSDLAGSKLFERGGFELALVISTIFTALIWIPIFFVPRNITELAEGERIVDSDGPVAESLATA